MAEAASVSRRRLIIFVATESAALLIDADERLRRDEDGGGCSITTGGAVVAPPTTNIPGPTTTIMDNNGPAARASSNERRRAATTTPTSQSSGGGRTIASSHNLPQRYPTIQRQRPDFAARGRAATQPTSTIQRCHCASPAYESQSRPRTEGAGLCVPRSLPTRPTTTTRTREGVREQHLQGWRSEVSGRGWRRQHPSPADA
mmetsp:Transcript_36723/g.88513  ORF Transcript_36723/g.88513 Transcript_36723/m.88513 type:complete len:202 (-) Transcript_36723:59-664(-)